jgi:Plasmid replication region DNA-binding N-term
MIIGMMKYVGNKVFNMGNMENKNIENQVNQIKLSNSNTKQVYIEVARLLFIQYQEMPTANRLYSLVKKGSMSTVVEAMKIFWQEMQARIATKVNIASNRSITLPEQMHYDFIHQMEKLWELALEKAAIQFDEHKAAHEQQILELNNTLTDMQALLQERNQYIINLEESIKSIESTNNTINIELSQNKEINNALQIKNNELYTKIIHTQAEINEQKNVHKLDIARLNDGFNLKISGLEQDIKYWQKSLDSERVNHKNSQQKFSEEHKKQVEVINLLNKNIALSSITMQKLESEFNILQQEKIRISDKLALLQNNNDVKNNLKTSTVKPKKLKSVFMQRGLYSNNCLSFKC